MKKECNKCGKIKFVVSFGLDRSATKDGLQRRCKECKAEDSRIRNKKIKEENAKKRQKLKKRKKTHKVCTKCHTRKTIRHFVKSSCKCIKCRKIEYNESTKDKVKVRHGSISVEQKREKRSVTKRRYKKNRMKKDVKYKLAVRISEKIRQSLVSKKREYNSSLWEILGYTPLELKSHLESNFKEGMNWGNYGLYGWHIDHIKPKSSYKYETIHDKECLECWSLSNLQPLWAEENLRKSNKISQEWGNVTVIQL